MCAGKQSDLDVGADPGEILVGPAQGEIIGNGHTRRSDQGKVVLHVGVEIGIDQVEALDIVQILLREAVGVDRGHAALVGADEDPVAARQRDAGKAVFALKAPAAAAVDAQLVQRILQALRNLV